MNTSSAVLKVTKSGKIDLFSDKNEIIWSTNTSRSVQSPVALLLDSGNLVVKDANDGNPENFLWQSFNFPTDTFLPNQKLGGNFKTGHEVYLSAWKNDKDPTPGEFTFHIDPTGYPQALIRRGTRVSSRAGPWNDLQWNGAPAPLQIQSSIYTFQFVFNKEEVYYRYSPINNGYIQRCTWEDPLDTCDTYNLCGAYGSCVIDSSPFCGCLEKFVPKYPQQWEKGDWSEGCVRRKPYHCNKEHVFLKYSGIKLPDIKHSQYDKTTTLEARRQLVCSRNCSCTAYSSLDISNGDKGCLFWCEELIDIRKLSGRGQDIYIRTDSSELGNAGRRTRNCREETLKDFHART